MKNSTRLIAVIIAVLVVSVTASLLSATPKVVAQDVTPDSSREKTISVNGVATASVKPDQLNINFGVETQEKTAKQALDSNSIQMNNVILAIKKAGIDESNIGTSYFNIYPVYESYEDKLTARWTQEIVGYGVSNIVTVQTSKLDSAAAIIDNVVNAGVNRIDSVYFSLSSSTQQKLKDDLLEKAIINAKTRAEKALTPLDHKIIGVQHVSLDEFVIPFQNPMYKGISMDMESRAPTPVFSSDQEISTSVQVVFVIGSN
ncbi:MAG TPA: SIMPL domain-containing protein [Nitrosopumilaceae archaeon]|nr:SIMPL domain-containing protein [Nitrosopumilaceae archaeon]